MANESALWKWMSAAGEPPRPGLHMQRVENTLAVAGPDVEGQIGPGGHFHVELKVLYDQAGVQFVDRKPDYGQETGRLKFRQGQREWGRARWEAGGVSYALIEGFRQDLYLIPGAYLMALERISTVKTGYLRSLCVPSLRSWDKKSPDLRDELFFILSRAEAVREGVDRRLQHDPQLREASQRDGALAQAIGSLPAA